MKYKPEVIQDWIDAINDEGINLTDWEKDFMINISDSFPRWQNLTDKQEEILERIYTNRVP